MHSPSSDQAYDATAEPHAPHIPAVGLPVIVSSSAESDEAPQVVHTAGGKHRGGGLVANWAPGAALKRPLAMQRSLSGFFGLRSSGIPDGDGPAMSAERRVSHGSTMSDGSSVLEDGTSGILYLGAQQKTAGSTAAMDVVSGWNAGERRRRLPQGASGVVLHKDLWKIEVDEEYGTTHVFRSYLARLDEPDEPGVGWGDSRAVDDDDDDGGERHWRAESITPRPMFSPTAEALNVHSQQQRSSLSPNSSAGGSSYFPAMPPPSKPFLPGEEPNRHVNGVLSNYPLAYKPAPASGSNVTSPFTSRPPSSVDLSGIATRRMGTQGTPQGATRLPPAHMRIDLPHGGYVLDDPTSSKASSARLLTPEREWVPGAWGYAKETFDPDVETDTEDEDDDGDEVDALVKRTRSRLIVDGDIRLKTRADAPVRETTSTTGEATGAQVQSSSNTRLMPWSTF
ncbi:hypothetical protein QFC19_003401 [Naganishia cerealis]|uniref:Uncharacterized protein n=1 Tax=Naganishia cerealis TaxID=610337 RepID=A0ACC2W372_9TREE|nr:hypothetical protein QFC19_003401 [Naganishia cerealis]